MRVCHPMLNHPMDFRTWSSFQYPSFVSYNCTSSLYMRTLGIFKTTTVYFIQTFGLSLIIYFLEDSPNLNKIFQIRVGLDILFGRISGWIPDIKIIRMDIRSDQIFRPTLLYPAGYKSQSFFRLNICSMDMP